MASRGRPLGHKLSEETKARISESKTGYIHTWRAKRKTSKSVRKYFKTPAGIAQRQKMAIFQRGFWNSDEGIEFRNTLGQSMKSYYEDNFK